MTSLSGAATQRMTFREEAVSYNSMWHEWGVSICVHVVVCISVVCVCAVLSVSSAGRACIFWVHALAVYVYCVWYMWAICYDACVLCTPVICDMVLLYAPCGVCACDIWYV